MISLRNIPLLNIKAHPGRTLILFVLVFAQAVCATCGIALVGEMRRELRAAEARLGADLLVYPMQAASKISMKTLLMQGTPVHVYKERAVLSKMDSCEGIAAISHQLYVFDTGPDGSEICIVGYEPESDFVLAPWFEGGATVDLPAGCVAVGSRVYAEDGERVALFGKKWTIGAHLMETGSSLDDSVFAPMDTLKELLAAAAESGVSAYASMNPETVFSVALVRVADKSRLESVTDWINIYVRKVKAVHREETLSKTASGIRGSARVLAVSAALAWTILLAALCITQAILMKERRKEMQVWYAVGASGSIVRRSFMSETAAVYAAGAAAGALAGLACVVLFAGRLLPGAVLSARSGLLSALAALGITLMAGLFAAYVEIRGSSGKSVGQMLLM